MSRPEPPPHVLVRDANTSSVWQYAGPEGWVAQGMRAWLATWEELDGGKFGEIELLVPVPYVHHLPRAQDIAEALLNPVAEMMQQLAAAAGAGVTAVVADAYQRGRADQLAEPPADLDQGPTPWPAPGEAAEHG